MELLDSFGGEAGFAAEDHVDSLGDVRELGGSSLVPWFLVFFVALFLLVALV